MGAFKDFIGEAATAATTKYKGVFNWHGENIPLYCSAASKAQAEILLRAQLAKKLNVTAPKVASYYKSKPNGMKVTEVRA